MKLNQKQGVSYWF